MQELEDHLAKARSLVNGTTIALHDAGDVCELEYFHIKLQSHDVIYAEGAPCETFAESADHFVPVLSFAGSRSLMKSHLRNALSPLVDRREKIDVIRDRLVDRALTLASRGVWSRMTLSRALGAASPRRGKVKEGASSLRTPAKQSSSERNSGLLCRFRSAQ